MTRKGDPIGDLPDGARLKPPPGQESEPRPRDGLPLKGAPSVPPSVPPSMQPSVQPSKLSVSESTASAGPAPYDSQPRPRADVATEGGSAGYVRFRVLVEGSGATIIDSQFIDSELLMPSTLYGGHVYEVTDGNRLLHAESLPDLGVQRGFVNTDGPPEQRDHHIYRLDSYEFVALVPAQEVTPQRRGSVAVVLYRVKEAPVARQLRRDLPLQPQFSRELREVARVDGIAAESLPEPLRGS